ncbi:MAG: hypothetical protein M4579_005734 [Chaenotheca gracillima]|nr:MAG: hypothetical protein M4579_005734 [Chaenotheca gracillima]
MPKTPKRKQKQIHSSVNKRLNHDPSSNGLKKKNGVAPPSAVAAAHAPKKSQAKQHHQQQHANPTIPFHASDRILLIGEGDFSFAHSMHKHHAYSRMTATSLDDETVLFAKYPQARTNIADLVEAGVKVLWGVDAAKADLGRRVGVDPKRGKKRKRRGKERERDRGVVERKPWEQDEEEEEGSGEEEEGDGKKAGKDDGDGFDRIIFNFPHVGGKSTDVNRQVRYNQELLVSFFRASTPLLKPGTGPDGDKSTIIVTLFEGEPYSLWNIRDLARHVGLKVVRSFRFQASAYPGYTHARTLGNIVGRGVEEENVEEDSGGEGECENGDEEDMQSKEGKVGERRGWRGEERAARSYVFQLDDGGPDPSTLGKKRKKKRKGGGHGSSSDTEG